MPPGTKLIVHSKLDQQKSWDYHGIKGYYVRPSLNHYLCITTYIPQTHAERKTDTAVLIPTVIPIPEVNVDDHIKATGEKLIHLLTKKKFPLLPFT